MLKIITSQSNHLLLSAGTGRPQHVIEIIPTTGTTLKSSSSATVDSHQIIAAMGLVLTELGCWLLVVVEVEGAV